MECPNCGLLNAATAQRCDCGFDFGSRTMERSLLSSEELQRAAEDPNPVFIPFLGTFVRLLRWLHGSIRLRGRYFRQIRRLAEFEAGERRIDIAQQAGEDRAGANFDAAGDTLRGEMAD